MESEVPTTALVAMVVCGEGAKALKKNGEERERVAEKAKSVIGSREHGWWMNRTRSISRTRVPSSSASSGAKGMDALI